MKRIAFLILLIFSLIIIIQCDTAGLLDTNEDSTFKEIPLEEVQLCDTDSDCMIVENGCCGCANGGSDISINKKYEEYWQKKSSIDCIHILCATVYLCPEISEPACVEKKCNIIVGGETMPLPVEGETSTDN